MNHKFECDCIIRWRLDAPEGGGPDGRYLIPPDTVRCIGRLLWRRRKLGNEDIWVSKLIYLYSSSSLINCLSGEKSKQCNLVRSSSVSYDVCAKELTDRHEIPLDKTAVTYVQLAHTLMKYMGIKDENELAEFGVGNTFELVDIFSKVMSLIKCLETQPHAFF